MMLITKESTETYARREAGGKGYNLYLLTREGLNVPAWVILGAECFRQFRRQPDMEKALRAALRNDADLKKASEAIRSLILDTPLPAAVESLSRRAYSLFNASKIAVRSSALDEDSAKNSFAGQLSTFLFISSEDEAIRALKECWASAYSERSLSYRRQNALPTDDAIDVAVIFQEMVDCEKSGVLFTCDPVHRDPDVMVVNAVYGLGEGLVSGLLDADTYRLEKNSGTSLATEVATKKSRLVRHPVSGTSQVDVPEKLRDRAALDNGELRELAKLGRDVERIYRFPQDIEWGWKGGRFYLLQSRPVTTDIRAGEGTLQIWDNSNIVESYGGLTLPLTFTFARFVYHQVYVQFCEILMVPQRHIREMDFFLRNMLGLIYGRVYYNLLNWYKLTSILPGFRYNRSFMETMMGTPHSLSDEIADRIKPPLAMQSLTHRVRSFLTGIKLFWFHLTIQKVIDRFLAWFHAVYDEYRAKRYDRMPADEIFAHYQDLERKVLRSWKAPIINDYLCMIHFGLLKKLTHRWLGPLGESLQNDLLCGDGNLESAEPTRELIRLSWEADRCPPLKELLLSTAPEDCLEGLKQSEFRDFTHRIDAYIDRFGFRCMSEMKLEQKDLNQDPSFLFVCLKNYLRAGVPSLEDYEKSEQAIRRAAEDRVSHNLKGLKRWAYLWTLKHARKAVRNRENTRFCRTRIYGVVRSMFFAVGRDYVLRNIIDRPEDIFYITVEEFSGSLEGTLTTQDLRALISLRKKEYEKYAAYEPAPRFMTRGPVYWMNDHKPEEKTSGDDRSPTNGLKGTGCCPGVVEGIVKIIMDPSDNMDLDGQILVTMRTDPGWIPLYPSISGLLVERGGLLSHSAIVAREMGLPTIVGIKGLTQRLKNGMKIRLDGQSGAIEILS